MGKKTKAWRERVLGGAAVILARIEQAQEAEPLYLQGRVYDALSVFAEELRRGQLALENDARLTHETRMALNGAVVMTRYPDEGDFRRLVRLFAKTLIECGRRRKHGG